MCGIVGKINFDRAVPVNRETIAAMCSVLEHRGPDDEGIYCEGNIGLGHRRLSIIDLSPLGHQPMCNEDGTVWITFNGEIYNFQELRVLLQQLGHQFRSNTDTEVIVHLYEEFGADCVSKLRGMFAFAIWDARNQRLFLARDRVGKKPLVYTEHSGGISFASEIKALLADPATNNSIDPDALDLYLHYSYVPGPRSAFKNIRKLQPGHILIAENGKVSIRQYWELDYRTGTRRAPEEYAEQLREVLSEAVRIRLMSDVPLGAFLSGGIDSSIVVALMAQHGSGPVKTFSIGFENDRYNELQYARIVADRYSTDHHELVVKPSAVDLLPKLVWHYDEPFADSSAIPTYYVSKMAREHVTVALNGDGGDESFAGYDRYWAMTLLKWADVVPGGFRRALAKVAVRLGTRTTPKGFSHRLGRILSLVGIPRHDRYEILMSLSSEEQRHGLYSREFAASLGDLHTELISDVLSRSAAPTDLETLLDADVRVYLPNDLLAKVDIASMACSLEARSPFLDHKVMQFAASIPGALKMRFGNGKYILKQAFQELLPSENLNRKKMGFGVPLYEWFRSDLREMAHDILLSQRARERGLFDPQFVRRMLDEHERGVRRWQDLLWALLFLELWFERFVNNSLANTRTAPWSVKENVAGRRREPRARSKKVKVLFLHNESEIGGSETNSILIAGGMDSNEFETAIYCLRGDGRFPAKARANGIRVINGAGSGKSSERFPGLIEIPALYRMLAKEKFNVVYAFGMRANLLARFLRPFVRMDHLACAQRGIRHLNGGWLVRSLEQFTSKQVDCYISNSKAARELLISRAQIVPQKVGVIYNGLPDGAPGPCSADAVRLLELKKTGCKLILSVGNFFPIKGHNYLLEGMPAVIARHPKVRLLLAGRDDSGGSIPRMIRRLGLESYVELLGFRSDVGDLLRVCDLKVLASVDESMSTAVLEAMGSGKPVVVTDVGGMKELVRHGRNGLVVPPRDSHALTEAINWMLDNPEAAANMGEEGRKIVSEQFRLELMIARHEAVFRRLVQGYSARWDEFTDWEAGSAAARSEHPGRP